MRTYGDILSVTTILSICGYYAQMKYATELDLEFGTLIHQQCALIARGKEPTNKNEFVLAYCEQFRRWLGSSAVIASEQTIIGKQFAGTLDLIVDKPVPLIDIKTSAADCRAYQLQTAGYQMLCNDSGLFEKKIRRRGVLLLSENGFKFIEHKNEMDTYIFKSCVNVANDLIRNKIINLEEK
jgi:hypothetical protein